MLNLIRPKPRFWTEEESNTGTCQRVLPYEVWLLISTHLNLTDIYNLLATNRELHRLAYEGTIWINRFGVFVETADNSSLEMAAKETIYELKMDLQEAWAHQFYHVYTRDEDIPFMSYGKHSRIGGAVETVKRCDGCDDSARYTRKSLIINEPDKGVEAETKRKLLQEAKVLLRARHNHVVKVVETYFFVRRFSTIFSIIMERTDGNLDAYLKGKTPRRTLECLAPWVGCLVGVTTYIHGLGIQHSDIKPSNILVKDGRLLLADFGISTVGLEKTMPTLIRTFGCKEYCAPELQGERSGPARPADIFSLGAVFLEMLIAHSCSLERQKLEEILCSRGHRSYARSVDRVQQLIDELEQRFQSVSWYLKVLSCCRGMLRMRPDERPLAYELNSAWQSLQSSDLPLVSCTCLGI